MLRKSNHKKRFYLDVNLDFKSQNRFFSECKTRDFQNVEKIKEQKKFYFDVKLEFIY